MHLLTRCTEMQEAQRELSSSNMLSLVEMPAAFYLKDSGEEGASQ